jgi:hypothetical protein
MPELEIIIGDKEIITSDPEAISIQIDYSLEDPEDFQKKKSSQALDITVPATLVNSQAANTFHVPSIADLTEGEIFRNPQRAVIRAKGNEVLVGKALLTNGTHTDKPEEYIWNIYGDNADWMMDLQEASLFDFVKHITFTFSKSVITDSWQYDGTDEDLPYVFAPVRYRQPMGNPDDKGRYDDYNMLPTYFKPSLSKYWILYWGFKSLGYRLSSEFFNTEYFRRQTMPWTWGNFLYSDGTRLENLDFLAKSRTQNNLNDTFSGVWDLLVDNDSTEGAFDNNDVYTYDASTGSMIWEYKVAFNYGKLEATVKLQMFVEAVAQQGTNGMWVDWYHITPSGTTLIESVELFLQVTPFRKTIFENYKLFQTVTVNPGDKIMARVRALNSTNSYINASVDGFELAYFRIPLGGTIDFENYTAFKKYKFLDFLRGIVDDFNLSIKTDVINKVVLMEPTHPYILPGETTPRTGFFNDDFIDWSEKLDYSKKGSMDLFSEFEKQVFFKYKNDVNDGVQKVVQDRYTTTLAQGKYILSDRFKAGKKEYENRFFSATMHYEPAQWKAITGEAPQMICIIPENISNTSESESESTFLPKSAYYKGIVNGWGWVFDGEEQSSFPFMFAVNYKDGENDPVLSYSDERIGAETTGTVVKGLLKTFFWQRMAIIRNGQWHTAYFKLNNTDVAKPWHREFKAYLGQRWELIEIDGFAPMKEDSTKCVLRKWSPIMRVDYENTYPSQTSVLSNVSAGSLDTKYSPLKCLQSDIPK